MVAAAVGLVSWAFRGRCYLDGLYFYQFMEFSVLGSWSRLLSFWSLGCGRCELELF